MLLNGRIRTLDSLRGISALVVLTGHLALMTPQFSAAFFNEPYDSPIVRLLMNTILHTFVAGHEAVLLFFTLSGFVLALPFLKNERVFSYSDYIIKRFCRIYIPYICVMTIASLLMVSLSDYKGHSGMVPFFSLNRWDHPLTLEAIISYIFMLGYDNTNVNGPTWSLVHEMRISFFFPLIMLLVIKFNWKISLLVGTFISMFIFAIFSVIESTISNAIIHSVFASFKNTFYYATFFIFGAIFAKHLGIVKSIFDKFNKIVKGSLFLVSLIFINFDEIIPAAKADYSNPYFNQLIYMFGEWIVALGVLILFTFAIYSVKFQNFLKFPLFLWLGKISYSLYLTHLVTLIVVMYTLGKIIPVYIALSIVPLVAFVVASIAHKIIEKPSQKLAIFLISNKDKPLYSIQRKSI